MSCLYSPSSSALPGIVMCVILLDDMIKTLPLVQHGNQTSDCCGALLSMLHSHTVKRCCGCELVASYDLEIFVIRLCVPDRTLRHESNS